MNIQQAIGKITENQNLSFEEMHDVMQLIMQGEATPAQVGGFLVGLRMKGETGDEIAGAAKVMRELASKINVSSDNLVDTCGTGGDSSGTFNISTASAFVAAGAGAKIAKHGNRSVSSSCGSADVLEELGVNINLEPAQAADCLANTGICFMFAPKHHSAMRHAIGPRKEMAIRTVFNLLGPLTNPAGAKRQVIGVFSDRWLVSIANVLNRLGSEHVLVVHGEDGLDEISISGATHIAELKNGEVNQYAINPGDFGLNSVALAEIKVTDAAQSKQVIEQVLGGESGAARDIVVLNAAAAIYVAGLADNLGEGVELAQQSIDQGKAKNCLNALITHSNK